MTQRTLTVVLLVGMAAVAQLLPMASGRPQSGKGYGSWSTFSGIGGSTSLSGTGSLGTNVGVGVHHSSAAGGGGGQYGFNVFGGKTASASGGGAINLGAYQGGYRYPVGGTGYPNFGAPNFGRHSFMG